MSPARAVCNHGIDVMCPSLMPNGQRGLTGACGVASEAVETAYMHTAYSTLALGRLLKVPQVWRALVVA